MSEELKSAYRYQINKHRIADAEGLDTADVESTGQPLREYIVKPAPASSGGKSKVELFVELTKALVWPLIVAIVLINFWGQIKRIADRVPDMVANSDSVSVAGVTIKVRKNLKDNLPPDVQKALATLSPESLDKLINVEGTTTWQDNYAGDDVYRDYRELIGAGFMEVTSPEALKQMYRGNIKYLPKYGIEPTKKGKETRKTLLAILADTIHDAAHPESDEAKEK